MVPQINLKDLISSQILQPRNACESHPHTYNADKISMQTAVFYIKICNFISLNHTFSQD